jgi:hypothetical protein
MVAGLVVGMAALPVYGQEAGTGFNDAVEASKFNINLRWRYEYVDQESRGPSDPVTERAKAATLRTRLVYTSGKFHNFSVVVNVDDLRPVGSSDFNSTRNGKRQYPVVADPKGTDLNLALLSFTGLKGAKIVLGRQRIKRADDRFIGNVGWRQNEQTYDSASIDYSFTEKFQAFYAYVDKVRRIFGPDDGTPAASFDSNSHLLDAGYKFSPELKLTAYAYLLDLENAAALSSQTIGLRLAGKKKHSDELTFSYAAEYATQQDYGDNPISYDEGYYVLNAGLDWAKFGFKVGYEVLEGNGMPGQSFKTPLATLHAFNGFADKFLATPSTGLKDLYIKGTAKGLGGNFSLTYHDFSAQTGGGNYGSELDFTGSWSFKEHYSVLGKFALYSADEFATDTDKVWIQLMANF